MAGNNEAKVTLKIFNEDFNNGLKKTKDETSRLNKEFELQKQQMKLSATETEKLAAKLEHLQAKQQLAAKTAADTEAQYEKVKAKWGENSQEAQKMANALTEAKIAEQKLSNEVELTSRAIEKQSQVAEITADTFNGEFNASMRNLDSEANKLKQSFALQEEQMRLSATESEKLSSKLEYLNSQHELAVQRAAETAEQYERVTEQFGANSEEAENMASVLTATQLAEQILANEIQQTNDQLENQADAVSMTADEIKTLGETTKDVGQAMATSFGAAAVAINGGLGVAVKGAADFDSSMRKAGAIAGATTEEFEAMRQTALDLGATTSLSASEVAEAMTELAAKGFDANQTIAAMPGIISAAEASGEDLALAADTVSSALNIWGLEASESSKVADVLAQTANTSAASILDMQYALKYAGTPAKALGVSLEETSAAIALMVDAGMKGEQAGTTLRGALLGLLDPSEENSKLMHAMGIAITDTNGDFVGLSQLISNLQGSMSGMTETQKAANIASLVGKEAVSGMLTLMAAGPEKIDAMTASLENSGGASAEAAEKMKAGIGGALENLGGAIDSFIITVGDQLVPIVQQVAEWVTELINKFSALPESLQQFLVIGTAVVGVLSAILAAVGFVVMGIGQLMITLGPVILAITEAGGVVAFLSAKLAFLGPVFTALTGPIGITIAAITAIIAIMVLAYNKVDWFREEVNAAWEKIKAFTVVAFEFIKNIINTIMTAIVTFVKSQLDKFKSFWDENGKAIMAIVKISFEQMKATIEMVMGIIKGIFQVVWPIITSTVRYAWETIKLVVSTAINIVLGIIQTVLKILQGDWKGAWDTILQTVKNIWSDVGKYLKGINLAQTGRDIIQGLIKGIGSMASAVWDKVKSIADGIKNAITGALQIHSPSRVTMGYGENVGEGLIIGMDDKLSKVRQTAAELAKMVSIQANPSKTFDNNVEIFASQPQVIQAAPIYLDGQLIAEATFSTLNRMQYNNASINAMVKGVTF